MKKIKFVNRTVTRKYRRIGNVVLAWLLVIGVLATLLFAGVKLFMSLGRNSLRENVISTGPKLDFTENTAEPVTPGNTGEGSGNTPGQSADVQATAAPTAVPTEEPNTVWEDDWIRYNGAVYEYNDEILTFLVMGIDQKGEVKPNKTLSGGGQADALILAVANPETKEINLININRDTMVDVTLVGVGTNGEDLVSKAQLATQHGFGDGMQQSCELTVDAVSKLFYELPIHGYLSFNLGGLTAINDAVGGVTVTIASDMTSVNKAWTQGTTVTLKGNDVINYVKKRDTKVFESNRMRLDRQKTYLSSLMTKMLEQVKKDITLPVKLYNQFNKYMVTDLSMDEIAYLAGELSGYQFNTQDIYLLEGETQINEKFEEFYPDKEALRNLIVEVFYRQVEESRLQ